MVRSEIMLRLLLTALAGAFTVSSIVACNAILGIKDVTLKGDGGDEQDGSDVDPGVGEPRPDSSVPPRPNVLQTALGAAHSCARKPEGTVRCWGDDMQGQTGQGKLVAEGFLSTPSDVAGITDAVDIAAGRSHTCVARKSGKVSCWGFNLDGQLGNGETANRKAAPVEVVGLTGAVAVAAGGNFSCALRRGGSVACWGGNGAGQLGKGDDSPSAAPVLVPGLSDVVGIAAGLTHACAVKNTGAVLCWGEGASGQLGKGQLGSSATPVAVANLTDAEKIAAGERSTCAITKTGAVLCWGANDVGQLGNGASTTDPTLSPVAVTNLSDASSVMVGRAHVCAARKTGAVVCWGAGARGQLGDGVTRSGGEAQATFVSASGIQDAIGITAGADHSCAPATTNQIMCWGANERGQLGNSSTADQSSPVAVSGYP
jgi:alpha-tubulin suppressor-like RCC1 family protein